MTTRPSLRPRLADEKWASIAADFGGTCVWYRDGCGTGVDELPITPGLRAALDGWCAWYGNDYSSEPEHDRLDHAAFNSVGSLLIEAVRRALPDWDIHG